MNDATKRVAEGWGFTDLSEVEKQLREDIDVGVLALLLLIDQDKRITAIDRKVDKLMADLSGLEAAVQKISEVDQSAAQSLAALRDEVAELQAGEISQEQIDSLASKLNDASTQLANAVTPPAPEETPAPPAEETPPAEGGETPPAE